MSAHPERKKVSVGAVVLDGAGQVLLVNPSYKAHWDLPGGIAEPHEGPVEALAREVREELGVDCTVGSLAAVDYGASDWEGADVVMLTFFATLHDDDFRLQSDEVSEARRFPVPEALELVTSRMRDRLKVALGLTREMPHGILVWRPPAPAADDAQPAARPA